jgi:hypothetical protein
MEMDTSEKGNGLGLANAFGLPIPKEGEELILLFEEGTTKQNPDKKCIKARHPSGVMLFIHRDFYHVEVKGGERWNCKILRVMIDNEQQKGFGFVQPMQKVFNQEKSMMRLPPEIADTLLIGIDIKTELIERLRRAKLKEQGALLNITVKLNGLVQEVNNHLEDLSRDIEELDGFKQYYENARRKYEPQTVTDEIEMDKSVEAGPQIT